MHSVHGGNLLDFEEEFHQKPLDFSANINPYGLSKGIRQALIDAVDEVIHYPDPSCRRLREALGRSFQLNSESILCGNGAADLIFRLVQAIRPQKALLLAPTFSEYEKALRSVSCEISYYSLTEADGFLLKESFLSALTPDLDLLILCNPNNPTGQPVSQRLLDEIQQICETNGIFLLADECFEDFLLPEDRSSYLMTLKNHPNTAVLRAFTKMYALPGIRLGMIFSFHPDLLKKMERCGQAWSVSVLAEEAGLAALREKEFVCQSLLWIQQERRRISDRLSDWKIPVWGKANFLFFRLPIPDFQNQMARKGILVRSCANYQGLSADYYRIAVRKPEENDLLLQALLNILEENQWQKH